MEVEHMFSYPLHSELWSHGLVTPEGIIIADEQELLQYKDFLEEKPAERAIETYKLRKNIVDEVQELLKEECRTPRQNKKLSSHLKCLGLGFAEDGFLFLQSEESLPKKHLGAKEPNLSIMERQVIEEDKRTKILTRDLMTLDEWLALIAGSNSQAVKPKYSKTMDWKALERKCRERNRKRMNEMEIKRRNKINNFDIEHDRTWRKMLAKTLPPKTMPQKTIPAQTRTQKGFVKTPSVEIEVTPSTSFTSISESVSKDKKSHVSFPKSVRKKTAAPKKISKKELENLEQVQIDGGKKSLESQKIRGIRKKKMSPGVHESKGLKLHDIEENRREITRQRLELFEKIVDKRTGVKERKQQALRPRVKKYDKETYDKIREAKYDDKTDKRPHFMRKEDIETKVDEAEKCSQKQSDEVTQKVREWEILHKKEHQKPILKDISKVIKDEPQKKEMDDRLIQVQSKSFEYPTKKAYLRKDNAVDQKIEDFLEDVMQLLDEKNSLEKKDSVKLDKHQKPKVEDFAEKKTKDCSQRSILGDQLKKSVSVDTQLKFVNQEELPIKESLKSSLKDFTSDQTKHTEDSLKMSSVLERDHVKPKPLNLTKSQERDKLDDNMFESADDTEDESTDDTLYEDVEMSKTSQLSKQFSRVKTKLSDTDRKTSLDTTELSSTDKVLNYRPVTLSSHDSKGIISSIDEKRETNDYKMKPSDFVFKDNMQTIPDKIKSDPLLKEISDFKKDSSKDCDKTYSKVKLRKWNSATEMPDDRIRIDCSLEKERSESKKPSEIYSKKISKTVETPTRSSTIEVIDDQTKKLSMVQTPTTVSISEGENDQPKKSLSSLHSEVIKSCIDNQEEADDFKMKLLDTTLIKDAQYVLDKIKSNLSDQSLGDETFMSSVNHHKPSTSIKSRKMISSIEIVFDHPKIISPQSLSPEDIISPIDTKDGEDDFDKKSSYITLRDGAQSGLDKVTPGLSPKELSKPQECVPADYEKTAASQKPRKQLSMSEAQDDRPGKTLNSLTSDDRKSHMNRQDQADELNSDENLQRISSDMKTPEHMSSIEVIDGYPKKISFSSLYLKDMTSSKIDEVDDFGVKPSTFILSGDEISVLDKILPGLSEKEISETHKYLLENLKNASIVEAPVQFSITELRNDDVIGVLDKIKSYLSATQRLGHETYSDEHLQETSTNVSISEDQDDKTLYGLSSDDTKSHMEDADDFMIKPPDAVLIEDVESVLDKVISGLHEKQSLVDETYSAPDFQKVPAELKISKRISSMELLIGHFDRLSLHRSPSVDDISPIGREEADDFKLKPSQNLLRDDTKSELDMIKSAKELSGYQKHSTDDISRMSARKQTPANVPISEVQEDSLRTTLSSHPSEDMKSSIDSQEETADFQLKLTDSFIRDDIKCALEKMKSDRSANEFPKTKTYLPEELSTSEVFEDIPRIVNPPSLEHKSLRNLSDKSSDSVPFTPFTKYFAAARDQLAERSSSILLTGESSRDISKSQSGQQQKLRKTISKVASKGKCSSKKDITDKITKRSQDQKCKLKSSRPSKLNFDHADEMKKRVSELNLLSFKDECQLKRGSVEADKSKYDGSKSDKEQIKEDLSMDANEESLPSPTIEVLSEMFEKQFSLDDNRKFTPDAKDISDVSEKVFDTSRKDTNRDSLSESSKIKMSGSRERSSISLLGDKLSDKTKSGDKIFPSTDERRVVDISKEHKETSKIVVQEDIDIRRLDKQHDEIAEEPTSPDSQKQMHAYSIESETKSSDYIQSSSLGKENESKSKSKISINQEDPMSSDDFEYRETKPSTHARYFRSIREKLSIGKRSSQFAKKDSPKQTSLKKQKDEHEIMEKKTENQRTELQGYKDTSKLIPKVKRPSPKQEAEEGSKNVMQSPKAEPQPGTSKSGLNDAESPRPISAARGRTKVWPFKQDVSDVTNIIIEQTRQMKANKGLELNKALYKNLDESEKILPKKYRWKK